MLRLWRWVTRYTGTVPDPHGRERFDVRGRVVAVRRPEPAVLKV